MYSKGMVTSEIQFHLAEQMSIVGLAVVEGTEFPTLLGLELITGGPCHETKTGHQSPQEDLTMYR